METNQGPTTVLESQFQCGACGDTFSSEVGLSLHLDGCLYAKHMMGSVLISYLGKDVGHVHGWKIRLVKKYRHLIERYVRHVITGSDSITRAQLHDDLCDALCVRHGDIRPFESSDIKKQPSFSDALDLFLDAYFLVELNR